MRPGTAAVAPLADVMFLESILVTQGGSEFAGERLVDRHRPVCGHAAF